MDDKPEERQDFKALYEERYHLEREQYDVKGAIALDEQFIRDRVGSPRQQIAWEDSRRYGVYRLNEINVRLIEIETAITGKSPVPPPLWTPSPEFQKTIQRMIDEYNEKRKSGS